MKKKIQVIAIIGIMLLSNLAVNAQCDVLNHVRVNGYYVGWAPGGGSVAGALDIRNDFTGTLYPIDFYIGNNKYMTLNTAGDLNIVGGSNGYKINTNMILWHGGNTNDIFVGASAGNTSMSGHNNTLVGKSAGVAITTGTSNTAIGHNAGMAITTGSSNTAVGKNAGVAVTTGTGTTFVGFEAGNANTTAGDNTAVGYQALHTASTLGQNVAVGYQALYSVSTLCGTCTGGLNTAVGYQALKNSDAYGGCALGFNAGYSNTIGCGIIAIGEEAMKNNTEGDYNLAIGAHSLQSNTLLGWNLAVGNWALNALNYTADGPFNTHNVALGHWALQSTSSTSSANGKYNTATGNYALYSNTTGTSNTANGYHAGYANTTGSGNTFVGYNADANANNLSNAGAFGNGALVLNSNTIYLGNSAVTTCINAQNSWTSDGRFKTNVVENVKGLSFINKLRPVTYNMDTKSLDDFIIQNMPDSIKASHKEGMDFGPSMALVHSGFIAQEVAQASSDAGFVNSIVHSPAHSNDVYAVSYAEIVVPLVKAVQELDASNTSLQDQVNELKAALKTCCNSTQSPGGNETGEQRNTGSIELQNLKTLQLSDADPNPFSESTMIRWNIPNDFKDAMIYFYDNNGVKINSYRIDQKGSGELQIFGSKLSSGIYVYSLVVDSKSIDSKKLVKAK